MYLQVKEKNKHERHHFIFVSLTLFILSRDRNHLIKGHYLEILVEGKCIRFLRLL